MTRWQDKTNGLKHLLRSGETPLIMWVTIPWPALIELAGAQGVNAVLIDLEHTSFGLDVAQQMIVSAEAAGVTALVRPSSIDPAEVSSILDAGAQGIVFPLVNTAADAKLAWRCLRYPPDGVRGWGGSHTRAAMWQGTSAVEALRQSDPNAKGVYSAEYVAKAADDIVNYFIVETVEGVNNIQAILEAGQPDLVSFGWGDFSVEVGFDLDRCVKAAGIVYDACRSRGIGVSVSTGQTGPSAAYPGCITIIGIDSLLLSAAVKAAVAAAHKPPVRAED
jgi:2-keto-3-deoxy-L-rhamnonate aldolase RhmA